VGIKFTKMHGAGNDYIYVDARQTEKDWPEVARRMSDRHFGVGGDGLILILPSSKADVRMRMFNADGSEAEMCGNGIRCFAKYVLERGIAQPNEGVLSVETLAGIIRVYPIWNEGLMVAARVNMGPPRLRPADVPVKLEGGGPVIDHPLEVDGRHLALTFVSIGNPHAVAFLDEAVADFPLCTIGPKVENHPLFPKRVNFEVVNVESRDALRMRVWERGSGETLACATGACAVIVAAHLKGLVNDKVDISVPGGILKLEWPGQGDVWLEGPCEEVFTGEWKESRLNASI
jgi:diaminopimelate epimerase